MYKVACRRLQEICKFLDWAKHSKMIRHPQEVSLNFVPKYQPTKCILRKSKGNQK